MRAGGRAARPLCRRLRRRCGWVVGVVCCWVCKRCACSSSSQQLWRDGFRAAPGGRAARATRSHVPAGKRARPPPPAGLTRLPAPPPAPARPGPPKGFTFELCAGLVDKGGKSLEQIAAEEVEEECGYRVPPAALRSVASAIASSGTTGAEHFIFYATVGARMRSLSFALSCSGGAFAFVQGGAGDRPLSTRPLPACCAPVWPRTPGSPWGALETGMQAASLPRAGRPPRVNESPPFGRENRRPGKEHARPAPPNRPQVDESMRVNPGGGLDGHGEAIEVLALPFSSAPAFVLDSAQPKSPGLMFGLTWARGALASGEVKGKKGGLETAPLELREVLPS